MSRRTAEASKAVALAWTNEQQRVKEGNGTRDWTPEQQKDILERGKAYDDTGRAFEGQHMKSVEKYPEYQGDPDNIQFLTKEEHLAAHQGNWQNPTNWYYNPVTKEFQDFGDGKYIPCSVIDLSEPIVKKPVATQESKINRNDTAPKNDEVDYSQREKRKTQNGNIEANPKKTSVPVVQEKSFFKKIGGGIAHIKEAALDFAAEHPVITTIVLTVGGAVGKEFIDRATSGGGASGGSSISQSGNYSFSSSDYLDDGLSDISESENIVDNEPSENSGSEEKTPQTKRPHDTRGYTRIRGGKEENVRGYSTGKNRKKTGDDE